LVLVPLAVGCLWVGGWLWAALVAVGSVGLALEYGAMISGRRDPSPRPSPTRGEGGGFLPATVFLAAVLAATGLAWAGLAVLAVGGALVWRVAGRAAALGVPYVGLTGIALIWLRADAAGFGRVLVLLLIVWATDIAAYLAGRLIGGPKLAPAISPGKTWSGAAGGLAGALVVGVVASPGAWGLAMAAVLSVVSQMGDLMESGIKRHYGVKDSGKLIPGHGGLLDRLDGVLTAAPVAAVLALLAKPGVGFWQ
jgi:phosphatidate cytidylyltransferase